MTAMQHAQGLLVPAAAGGSPPTVRGYAHNINSNVKLFVVSKVTGAAAGDDCRFVLVTGVTAGNVVSPPTHWGTAAAFPPYYDYTMGTTMRVLKWRRILDATDAAASSFTFTSAQYVNGCTIASIAIIGANATQTLGTSSANGVQQATMQNDPISVTVPSTSAPAANCLALVMECFANNATGFNTTISYSNSFVSGDIVGDSTASTPATRGFVIGLATKALTASGAVGSVASTVGHGGQSYRRSVFAAQVVTIAP